ncbi:MAG: TVP38/TMEM64 family protein [Myxococcota bacterium]
MDRTKLTQQFQKHRWLLVVVLLGALFLVGHATGLTDDMDADRVRRWVLEAGAWGVLLFLVLFSVGELMHVPGLVFVAAATYLYDGAGAILVALFGAITSVTVSFVVVRTVGGQPLGRIRWKFIRRMLAHLDERPITVVFLLRLVLWLAPIVNYVLAMSRVRFREYLVGSALGLAIPITAIALLLERLPDALEWVKHLGQ